MIKRYHTLNSARSQNTCTLRHATVLSNHYPPLVDDNDYCANYRPIPWINLRGHWLHHAGFSIGTPYTITVGEGSLLLQVVQANGEATHQAALPASAQVVDV